MAKPHNFLALDIGERRVGVALASSDAKLAAPFATIANDSDFVAKLKKIIKEEQVAELIVGLPRGLDGQNTPQTELVREIAKKLQEVIPLPLYLIDEALTSKRAREELEARGTHFTPEAIDALAATYILEDYLRNDKGSYGRSVYT